MAIGKQVSEGNTDLKRCSGCKALKPTIAFYKDRANNDGLHGQCKSCNNECWNHSYRTRSKFSDTYKAAKRKTQHAYRKRYPEKVRAHGVARNVPLAERCKQCGSTQTLHGHHPDYSQPSKIITLCDACHRKEHRRAA